jgi:hypothetical protein
MVYFLTATTQIEDFEGEKRKTTLEPSTAANSKTFASVENFKPLKRS